MAYGFSDYTPIFLIYSHFDIYLNLYHIKIYRILFFSNFDAISHKNPHITKKGLQLYRYNPLFLLVRPARFERAAYGFEVQESEN